MKTTKLLIRASFLILLLISFHLRCTEVIDEPFEQPYKRLILSYLDEQRSTRYDQFKARIDELEGSIDFESVEAIKLTEDLNFLLYQSQLLNIEIGVMCVSIPSYGTNELGASSIFVSAYNLATDEVLMMLDAGSFSDSRSL